MNAGMLGVARAAAPEIDWREGNATALPIDPDERFDVIVCHQGFQFFPDRAAAAREMRALSRTAEDWPSAPGAPTRRSPLVKSCGGSPSGMSAR